MFYFTIFPTTKIPSKELQEKGMIQAITFTAESGCPPAFRNKGTFF
jgi:hypothetical protein